MANQERWKQVDELFTSAADLPEAERDQYLADTCADPDILREVRALLCFDGPGAASLDLAIQQIASHLDDDDFWIGRQVGSYRIVRELGVGGMGTVYLAERSDQRFEKQVAIKLVHRGMDSPELRQKLLAERRILATLDHPYIAKLIDGGETTEGIPYFVMEYVEGQPVNRYAARLSTAGKCELLAKVCDGVSYAHRRLILHLDLKPSNILITAEGVPKLLDFGISAVLRDTATGFALQQ